MQTDENELFIQKGLTSFLQSFQQPLLFFCKKRRFICKVSNSFNRVFNRLTLFLLLKREKIIFFLNIQIYQKINLSIAFLKFFQYFFLIKEQKIIKNIKIIL